MTLAQIPEIDDKIASATEELIALGKSYHERGWCLGTSGNFSVVLSHDPLYVLVTASGKDKSRLTAADFVVVDEEGKPVQASKNKPSAETLLHIVAIKNGEAGAVLHTHSVWSTVLSHKHAGNGYLDIEGFEMLKGLAGIATHRAKISIPILDNQQDMQKFKEAVSFKFDEDTLNMKYAYLINKHGLHCWGKTLNDAKRHVEIIEFLLEATGRLEGGQ